MICPILTANAFNRIKDCKEKECMWWCDDDKTCAVKKIAMELIKLEERNGR